MRRRQVVLGALLVVQVGTACSHGYSVQPASRAVPRSRVHLDFAEPRDMWLADTARSGRGDSVRFSRVTRVEGQVLSRTGDTLRVRVARVVGDGRAWYPEGTGGSRVVLTPDTKVSRSSSNAGKILLISTGVVLLVALLGTMAVGASMAGMGGI